MARDAAACVAAIMSSVARVWIPVATKDRPWYEKKKENKKIITEDHQTLNYGRCTSVGRRCHVSKSYKASPERRDRLHLLRTARDEVYAKLTELLRGDETNMDRAREQVTHGSFS